VSKCTRGTGIVRIQLASILLARFFDILLFLFLFSFFFIFKFKIKKIRKNKRQNDFIILLRTQKQSHQYTHRVDNLSGLYFMFLFRRKIKKNDVKKGEKREREKKETKKEKLNITIEKIEKQN
jgi:hypothetical protein